MIESLTRKVVLFPFECFGSFVQSFMFGNKSDEVAPQPMRKLLQENARLRASLHTLTERNVFLQHQMGEQERHLRKELEQNDQRWRVIVRDLERKQSLERVSKRSQP